MDESSGRRRFLKSVGVLGGAAAIPAAAPAAETHAHAGNPKAEKYMFFSAQACALTHCGISVSKRPS